MQNSGNWEYKFAALVYKEIRICCENSIKLSDVQHMRPTLKKKTEHTFWKKENVENLLWYKCSCGVLKIQCCIGTFNNFTLWITGLFPCNLATLWEQSTLPCPPFPVLGGNRPPGWRWSWWWGRKPRWCKRWQHQTSAILPSAAHLWALLPASHGGSDNRNRNMTEIQCNKNKIKKFWSLYTHRSFYWTFSYFVLMFFILSLVLYCSSYSDLEKHLISFQLLEWQNCLYSPHCDCCRQGFPAQTVPLHMCPMKTDHRGRSTPDHTPSP